MHNKLGRRKLNGERKISLSRREEQNLYAFVRNEPFGAIDRLGLDVYKINVPTSSSGSSVSHREIVGDDGKGGVYVLSFDQKPNSGIHLFGSSCCGRGKVDVTVAANISAEDWIKENGATITKAVATPHHSVDATLADLAERMTERQPFYVLLFNDCGTIGNKFIEEAEKAVERWDDRNSVEF